jgi:hypothetical protein
LFNTVRSSVSVRAIGKPPFAFAGMARIGNFRIVLLTLM